MYGCWMGGLSHGHYGVQSTPNLNPNQNPNPYPNPGAATRLNRPRQIQSIKQGPGQAMPMPLRVRNEVLSKFAFF